MSADNAVSECRVKVVDREKTNNPAHQTLKQAEREKNTVVNIQESFSLFKVTVEFCRFVAVKKRQERDVF